MNIVLGDRRPLYEGSGHYVAHGAVMIGDVVLGDSASVWFGAVLRGDNDRIRIGARSNIQDGCVLHTDDGIELAVGDGVSVGHRAVLHGCRVGDRCLIGIGSIIMNGAMIGANTIVGAGSLVTENKRFPEGVLVLGSPARIVRELGPDELKSVEMAAARYVEKARHYRVAAQFES